MADDWYEKARKEFLYDLFINTETEPEAVKKIYSYLVNIGLIDYDTEKDFLWDEYADA